MMLFTNDDKIAINIDDIDTLSLKNIGQYHIIIATNRQGQTYEMMKYKDITEREAMSTFFWYIRQFNEWKRGVE